MDITTLQAQKREANGTRAARRLREEGKLPAIVYGHGEAPENVIVNTRELAGVVRHGAHIVQLDLGGQTKQVLIAKADSDQTSGPKDGGN